MDDGVHHHMVWIGTAPRGFTKIISSTCVPTGGVIKLAGNADTHRTLDGQGVTTVPVASRDAFRTFQLVPTSVTVAVCFSNRSVFPTLRKRTQKGSATAMTSPLPGLRASSQVVMKKTKECQL